MGRFAPSNKCLAAAVGLSVTALLSLWYGVLKSSGFTAFERRDHFLPPEGTIRLVPAPWTAPPPSGWTRFVCFSDTHGRHFSIPSEHLLPADVLLHAGDFTNTGELEQVRSFNKWLEDYPAKKKVLIAGNHDITFQEDYYVSRGAQRFHGGAHYNSSQAKGSLTCCTYLEDTSVEVQGYRIYGSPWQPDFNDWAFNLPRGEALQKCWAAIPSDTDILVVHGPPAGYVDITPVGRKGDVDLLAAIQNRSIPVVVTGHLHMGHGTATDGTTLFVNAATCTEEYAPIQPPIVFDLAPAAELRRSEPALPVQDDDLSVEHLEHLLLLMAKKGQGR
ncbi:Metallophosphoesterase domain-containing protein 1 [Symbiodinium microadriaticum]|uniref:Metallophosphoesterase domain-containing protein 1 n=1 Tax=Symbiodinium microadriaticum TaxID=2951 RepID=A0A1Q9E2G4_SYMMI|nr:Metallophosphoesterase domain-containing protein 1 [Symbiodinium microadriaticum]